MQKKNEEYAMQVSSTHVSTNVLKSARLHYFTNGEAVNQTTTERLDNIHIKRHKHKYNILGFNYHIHTCSSFLEY